MGIPLTMRAPGLPWAWSSTTFPSPPALWAHGYPTFTTAKLCRVCNFLIQTSQNQNKFRTFSSYGLPPKRWLTSPGILILPLEGMGISHPTLCHISFEICNDHSLPREQRTKGLFSQKLIKMSNVPIPNTQKTLILGHFKISP